MLQDQAEYNIWLQEPLTYIKLDGYQYTVQYVAGVFTVFFFLTNGVPKTGKQLLYLILALGERNFVARSSEVYVEGLVSKDLLTSFDIFDIQCLASKRYNI